MSLKLDLMLYPALINLLSQYADALVSFSPTSIDIMESDSINGTVCLVISDIPMGGLEYALEVTLESLPFGSTAGQYVNTHD